MEKRKAEYKERTKIKEWDGDKKGRINQNRRTRRRRKSFKEEKCGVKRRKKEDCM